MRAKISRERDWVPYMERALELAKCSAEKGDVPVGALVLNMDGKVIAEAHNERELRQSPCAHAEVIALEKASQQMESWRLVGCTLVVTLEPCVMCAGALSLSRIDRVVFGASDHRAGAMGSLFEVHSEKRLTHEIITVSGILEPQCRELLQKFFRSKRG